ncbi:facilitated trehalose transporter Tret1-like, partial [Diaphorina citri]|uniref:Facilitated trehalose transporter Tret1-like n=1 Tax=Diaphorina citri TaxID=121845 RepID=A0A1S3DHZ2_DIACI
MAETEKLLGKTKKSYAHPVIATSSNAADIIDISNGEHTDTPTLFRLIYLGLIVILPGVAPGMSFGFPAVALPQMSYLTIDQASWFASISAITMPIGCLLSGPIIDKYGRKSALMITNVPSLCGWLLMATKSDLINLYISRLLSGLSVGLATTPAAVYAAECITIHNTDLRGSLSTWSTIALTSGILLSYLTGAFFWYTTVAYIGAFVSFLSLVLVAMIIIPVMKSLKLCPLKSYNLLSSSFSTSPLSSSSHSCKLLVVGGGAAGCSMAAKFTSRLGKGQRQHPIGTVCWGQDSGKCLEHSTMKLDRASLQEALDQPDSGVSTNYSPQYVEKTLRNLQHFQSGPVLYTFPATPIKCGGAPMKAVLIGDEYLRKHKKRDAAKLTYCVGISMLIVAVYMSYSDSMPGQDLYIFSIIPFLAILSSVLMSGLGFIPIPYSMLGEVFPTNVKGIAGGIASSLSSIFCFIAIKTYPHLFEVLGPGIFYAYAFVAFSCCLFVRKYLP